MWLFRYKTLYLITLFIALMDRVAFADKALTDADINTGDAVNLEVILKKYLRIVGFVLSLRWAQIWADSLKNEATKVSNTH